MKTMSPPHPSLTPPETVLFIMGALGALGGLAALLRSSARLTIRSILSASLNSALLAVIIGALWWSRYGTANIYFLVGVATLAGFGGTASIQIALSVIRRFGRQVEDTKETQNHDLATNHHLSTGPSALPTPPQAVKCCPAGLWMQSSGPTGRRALGSPVDPDRAPGATTALNSL